MYMRDGQRLEDIEEGAAFFEPVGANELFGASPPPRRMLGLNENLLRRGFAAVGDDVRSPTSTTSDVRSPTSTRSEVRSPTSTRTEVRSPTRTATRTATKAYTQGNFTSTVTGGAGAGATYVTISSPPAQRRQGFLSSVFGPMGAAETIVPPPDKPGYAPVDLPWMKAGDSSSSVLSSILVGSIVFAGLGIVLITSQGSGSKRRRRR